MYTNKDYCKYMVAGIGNNNEYLLRLAQQMAANNSRVNTVPKSVNFPVTPKTTEPQNIDISAVSEVAQKYSGQVANVNPGVVSVPQEQPEVKSVSKEVALNLFSMPKYSAVEAYKKLAAASLYPQAKAHKVVDANTAPKSDSYKGLLTGADLVGVGFNGDNNINNKKIYFAA